MKLSDSMNSLQRFARGRKTPAELCEMCGNPIAETHDHLVEPAARRLLCVCQGCAILFSDDGRTNFRRVPREGRMLSGFDAGDANWNALSIPIGLAFFYFSSVTGRMVAIYPSPAGPTECQLDLGIWEDLARENGALASMRPDVEALLVNRIGADKANYIAPIDACYELVGLVRKHWKGFSGGEEAAAAIGDFFERLKQRAAPAGKELSNA